MRINDLYDEGADTLHLGTILKYLVMVVVVLVVVFGALGFVGGWFKTGTDIVSAGNVKEQNYAIIDNFESAKALSLNACQAQNTKTDENSPTLVEDPAFAYAAKYRDVVRDYNRRQRNLFEARIAGPPSYPDKIPNLETGADTDWCDINAQLDEMHL